jgi:hypothetical protein
VVQQDSEDELVGGRSENQNSRGVTITNSFVFACCRLVQSHVVSTTHLSSSSMTGSKSQRTYPPVTFGQRSNNKVPPASLPPLTHRKDGQVPSDQADRRGGVREGTCCWLPVARF